MRRTLRVVCALCVVFQLIVFVHVICELRIGFYLSYILAGILTVKCFAGNKVRKGKSSYYKARVYTSPKTKTRLENKVREFKRK